jgi:hypothetical protein
MAEILRSAYKFSLQQAWIAAANGDGTYGTAYQFPSAKTLSLDLKYISDKAQGNSAITGIAAQIIECMWQIDGVNFDPNIIAVLTGQAVSTASGGTSTQIDTQTFPNALMPYMAIVAQAWGEHGDDTCILLPYSKVTDGFTWKLDFGKYISPVFKGDGIIEPTLNFMLQVKNHATKLSAPVFPPAWA